MVRVVEFGFLGSGKTLSLVNRAWNYQKKHPDHPIYSNVPLDKEYFPNFKEFTDVGQLFDMYNEQFLGIDEAWTIANSYQFKSPESEATELLLIRSRKKKWEVNLTEQWFTQLVKRLRFIIDIWIVPEHFTKAKLLKQDFYDVHAHYITTKVLKCEKAYKIFDSYADPLTLNIEVMKARYYSRVRNRIKRGY